jgi:flagellar hook-basal body complex protein FliE
MDFGKLGGALTQAVGSTMDRGGAAAAAPTGPSFGSVLQGLVGNAVDASQQSASLTLAAAQGDSVALQDVIQAVSKAELTLQTLVSVRDRAVEAYQEIARMPV